MEKIIVITKEDFDQFKDELINEIKAVFDSSIKKPRWIRSKEVREMLGISDTKLQTLRINKAFPAYFLDGTWFSFNILLNSWRISILNSRRSSVVIISAGITIHFEFLQNCNLSNEIIINTGSGGGLYG